MACSFCVRSGRAGSATSSSTDAIYRVWLLGPVILVASCLTCHRCRDHRWFSNKCNYSAVCCKMAWLPRHSGRHRVYILDGFLKCRAGQACVSRSRLWVSPAPFHVSTDHRHPKYASNSTWNQLLPWPQPSTMASVDSLQPSIRLQLHHFPQRPCHLSTLAAVLPVCCLFLPAPPACFRLNLCAGGSECTCVYDVCDVRRSAGLLSRSIQTCKMQRLPSRRGEALPVVPCYQW